MPLAWCFTGLVVLFSIWAIGDTVAMGKPFTWHALGTIISGFCAPVAVIWAILLNYSQTRDMRKSLDAVNEQLTLQKEKDKRESDSLNLRPTPQAHSVETLESSKDSITIRVNYYGPMIDFVLLSPDLGRHWSFKLVGLNPKHRNFTVTLRPIINNLFGKPRLMIHHDNSMYDCRLFTHFESGTGNIMCSSCEISTTPISSYVDKRIKIISSGQNWPTYERPTTINEV